MNPLLNQLGDYEQRTNDETDRIWKAMMLAPTIYLCEALLNGEAVPASQLDPVWLERFGMRQA